MTDTPILDSFLSAMVQGSIDVQRINRNYLLPNVPLIAYEISDADAEDILRQGFDKGDDRYFQNGFFAFEKISAREAQIMLGFGDVVTRLIAGRITFFAFRSTNIFGPVLKSQGTVVGLHHGVLKQNKTFPVLTCFIHADSGWARQIMPFHVHPGGFEYVPEVPTFVSEFRLLDPLLRERIWVNDIGYGSASLMIINRFLTKLAEHATNIIYRTSTGRAHRVYNKARDSKAGIMLGPARVLDLSRPRIEVIPVGPSVLTGRTVQPHWRNETVRVYKSARYKNVRGQTQVVKGCGIHGATAPDAVKMLVRGLSPQEH